MVSKLLKTLGFVFGIGILGNCTNTTSPPLEEKSFQEEYGTRLFLDFKDKHTYIGFDRDNNYIEDFRLVYEEIGVNDSGDLVIELKEVWEDKDRDGKFRKEEQNPIDPENLPTFAIKYGKRLFLRFNDEYVGLCYDRDGNTIEDFRLVYEGLDLDKSGYFIFKLREIWEDYNKNHFFEDNEITPVQTDSTKGTSPINEIV